MAFDFTKPMAIGARIHTVGLRAQLGAKQSRGSERARCARLRSKVGKGCGNVHYRTRGSDITGNWLNGSVKGKEGLTYERWGAFTLEAEHYPDSPNHPSFPSTELKPGEKYSQTTIYKFPTL